MADTTGTVGGPGACVMLFTGFPANTKIATVVLKAVTDYAPIASL